MNYPPRATHFLSGKNQPFVRSQIYRDTNWIDWLKMIGMFFIVWGHLSPEYLKDFIYAFNVPVFFLVSGYLFRPCKWNKFINKNVRALIIPYFLLGLTVVIFFAIIKIYFGGYDASYFPLSILALFAGSQTGFGNGIGCQALWFVYTLFLAKCLANIIGYKSLVHALISIVFLYIAELLSIEGINVHSSYVNLLVAYPFFAIGFTLEVHLRDVMSHYSESINKKKRVKIVSTVLIMIAIVVFGSILNGMVEMYNSKFGVDLLLFVVNGLLGSCALALLCMMAGNKDSNNNIVGFLSRGSVLVLAWQIIFLFIIDLIATKLNIGIIHNDVITFMLAISIYMVFIPIIKIVMKHVPILVGNR